MYIVKVGLLHFPIFRSAPSFRLAEPIKAAPWRTWSSYLCTPRSRRRAPCSSPCSLAAAGSRFPRPPSPYQVSPCTGRDSEKPHLPRQIPLDIHYCLYIPTLADFFSCLDGVKQSGPESCGDRQRLIMLYYKHNKASGRIREWAVISFLGPAAPDGVFEVGIHAVLCL